MIDLISWNQNSSEEKRILKTKEGKYSKLVTLAIVAPLQLPAKKHSVLCEPEAPVQ